ncbi:DUF2971 domain-containing protein [Duganella sp. FT94W]|uniref:DUF2971 domain-containing protein n=1 Tax=Duganella lactea TaxID=2692173 RepID=A0ABW9VBE0_9BURK|nr:DUF2971 domain-containing protein [Duganella lactea]MYM34952.1 DUF2971 domain-containing protein [Duganella lactea]
MGETFKSPLDKPLYHYTGIEGLMGMISSRKLWAGNIHFMNDSEELKHAVGLLEEHLSVAVSTSSGNDLKRSHLWGALRAWAEEKCYEVQEHHLYIFSLSEVPSLLSQWRSYTPHGKGVSIGYSPQLLQQICEVNKCRLAKCVYDNAEKSRLFTEFTERLYIHLEETNPDCLLNFYACREAVAAESKNIFKVLALVKHEAFSEEREWRLISDYYSSLENAEFRPGSSMLTPYLEWVLPDVEWMYEAIILGPTPYPQLAWKSLRAMAHKRKLARTVVFSDIPYRVW